MGSLQTSLFAETRGENGFRRRKGQAREQPRREHQDGVPFSDTREKIISNSNLEEQMNKTSGMRRISPVKRHLNYSSKPEARRGQGGKRSGGGVKGFTKGRLSTPK